MGYTIFLLQLLLMTSSAQKDVYLYVGEMKIEKEKGYTIRVVKAEPKVLFRRFYTWRYPDACSGYGRMLLATKKRVLSIQKVNVLKKDWLDANQICDEETQRKYPQLFMPELKVNVKHIYFIARENSRYYLYPVSETVFILHASY